MYWFTEVVFIEVRSFGEQRKYLSISHSTYTMIDLSERIYDIILTILGTIIGGLISGGIGLGLYKRRLKDEVKRKHLEEIKEKCLKPLVEELRRLSSRFDISERVSLKNYCEMASNEINWWENFSFRNSVHDKILYEDLSNHFKKLIDKLNKIENEVIKTNYPRFLELLCKVIKIVQFRSATYSNSYASSVVEDIAFGTLMKILEYDKFHWPNVYKRLKEKKLLYLVDGMARRIEQEKDCLLYTSPSPRDRG